MNKKQVSRFFKDVQKVGGMVWRRLSVSAREMPSFIVIGTRKAGTTALYNYLGKHPDVVMPFRKEIKFFDCNFFRGVDWYRSFFPRRARLKDGKITGEASPYYILHPLTAQRIAQTLSEVKLIAMLRNPIDRAYSNYQVNVQNRIEALSFERATENEGRRLSGEIERILADVNYPLRKHMNLSYLEAGRYVEQLERWYEHIPPEQILLLKSEDFFEDTPKIYKQVLEFIGLQDWEMELYQNPNFGAYETMSPELRARLAEYFRPYNQRLYELVGRDFGWEA